ncbi:phytoene desaturase family protein [Raoultibacter phocaeensis]|uniref:phytoene desaturase family protein n=1 Tax=Raoultibacter phocaeensis TaxID=2479841 RepID=UPI0011180A14|nr:NAD(P)/FAD-dependent oxidoreductase [Raoultibacter phocaeensis]
MNKSESAAERANAVCEASGERASNNSRRSIAIVGAGIAGLAAGVYARQSGFNVTVYESHTVPGGASTSWKRKGYLFEGGMHWLTGSSPKTALNAVWTEIGALNPEVPIYVRDPFLAYEFEGRTIYLYRDVDRLEAHLLEVAPEDERAIRRLTKDVRKFMKVDMPISDIKGVKAAVPRKAGLGETLAMLPAMVRMPFYANQTARSFAERFSNPLLRTLFASMVGEDMSAVGLAFTLATLATGDGGYPLGGSLAMARRVADRLEQLGGRIEYRSLVERVVVRDGRATGVIVDGVERAFDAVIVTQDLRMAVDQLFDPPLAEGWAEHLRENVHPILDTFVSLGITADLSDVPENVGFPVDEPVFCGGQRHDALAFNNYAAYEGYAPAGCTAMTLFMNGDTYDWWAARKADGTYAVEKQKLAEAVIAAVSKKYPQIEGKVEVWDVATPLTYERYLRSYKGSWMSNMLPGEKMRSYPAKPEGVAGVYFAGQRLVAPGGLPTAVETARTAVQHLCKDEGAVFQGAQNSPRW